MKKRSLKYKIIYDIILNIIATAAPLIVLQLIILPYMAKNMSEDNYGYLLAIVSLITIVSSTFGNALNNVRLLCQTEFENINSGDFNIILFIQSIACVVIISLGIFFFQRNISWLEYFCIILFGIITLLREYFIVIFRIKLNYKAIVYNNLLVSVGYFLGYLFFIYSNLWILPYLIGSCLGCIHCIYKNQLLAEGIYKTKFLAKYFYKTGVLCLAGVLSNILVYADRLVIYPIMGGKAVSIYFAASFFGKLLSTAIGPIASVLLSHLAQKESLSKKEFLRLLIILVIVGISGYIIGICVAPLILEILYPMWKIEAERYLHITILTAMFVMVTSIVRTFSLRYCNINWQIVLNVIPVVVYFFCSILLFLYFGLYGFCIGVLIANIIKFMMFSIIVILKTQ